MSATQTALQSEDILHEIFKCLRAPLEYSERHRCVSGPDVRYRRTLRAAALTCRAFSQPALKVLWTHVSSIDALFCILSSSMKIVSDVEVPNKGKTPQRAPRHQETVWILDGPVTDSERERLIWYAQFIQTISLRTSRRVDPWVFLRLSHSNLSTPLAPRLHTIYCMHDWPYADMAVSLLSGTALRTLVLAFGGPDRTIADDRKLPLNRHNYAPGPLLRDVAAAAPGLEKLVVGMCAYAGLLHPIGGMKSLRELDLSGMWVAIDMALLQALAGLERLEDLALPNTFDGQDVALCRGFKNVRKLTVRGGIRTIPPLLAALPDLCLKELRLSSLIIEGVTPIYSLVSSLSPGSHSSLETVCIDDLSTPRSTAAAPVLTLIAPFLALPNIRSFNLVAADPLCITDEDLCTIGGAWPKLARLSLSGDATYEREPVAPTLHGIIQLTNMCPELHDVYFSLVALAFGPENSVAPCRSEDVPELALDIQVPDNKIRDAHHVARVLWSIFPRLSIINLDRTRFKKWAAVLEEVVSLRNKQQDD
ncbi:hypothetical protein DAEQUDRAFT_740996 [Daedalea quercina L-15889]|uniref:F-box domain-containing protein n=1 Tax=Daedalea quercina L-15889 TaxID=1314783 RepID=A0A165LUS4_9APHY|nr:hypothetical protein DAEQUDRAFT_740996 [Daedalea quercina L-15889]